MVEEIQDIVEEVLIKAGNRKPLKHIFFTGKKKRNTEAKYFLLARILRRFFLKML